VPNVANRPTFSLKLSGPPRNHLFGVYGNSALAIGT
jgi:hypothetical protein